MARKTHEDALGVISSETVIGSGVTIHGEVESESDVTVDGSLEGNVSTLGDINVGVNAKIRGNLKGANITIAGQLMGDVRANGLATIRETGHVKGDIAADGLAIVPGGVFIGRSQMTVPNHQAPESSS